MASKKTRQCDEDCSDDPVQLDTILGQLGGFGRHQLITLCMLALVYSTNSMYIVNYVFAVEDVSYR